MKDDPQMKMLKETRNIALHQGISPRLEVSLSEPINLNVEEVATSEHG
jgi:hypothetical protein